MENGVKDIDPDQIKDRWLRGMAEALEQTGIEFQCQSRTGTQWDGTQSIAIPALCGTMGDNLGMYSCQLLFSPDENAWDFRQVQSYAYNPLELGKMFIRKRHRELSGIN